MYTNPHIIGQIGSERQRDALARAEQQRRARRLRLLSQTTRQAEDAERRRGRALRTVARLRAVIPRTARPDQVEHRLPNR